MKSKKKKIIIISFVVIILMLCAGISYAIWNSEFLGSTNTLTTPKTELEFLESNNEVISIENAVPMVDEEGKTGGEEFDFQVRTEAGYDTSISYDLVLEKLEVDSGRAELKENEVKVYIEDFQGNVVLEPTKISELDNYKLVSKTNNHSSTNKEIKTKYKLRVWLDEDVDVFDNENKQIKFRININKYPESTSKEIVLTYDLNGGEGCTKKTVTYNEPYGELCTPTKENYDFVGWYTEKDGGIQVTESTNAVYDHIYAHWEENAVKIEVVVNNGSVVGNKSKYVKFGENGTFNLKANNGYGTPEVTCTNSQTGTINNDILTVSNVSKSTTCTVNYKANTYQVKYNASGGTGSMSNSTFTYDAEGTLSNNTFTKEGYTFQGWSKYPNDSKINYENGASVKNLTKENNAVVNLYAVWKINSYTVNVVVQNGTVDPSEKEVKYRNSTTFNLTPSVSGTSATVSCTNSQTASVKNNVLTVSKITNNTTCTVIYETGSTVLYTDGTLIINELASDRSANIETHGAVTNEYTAMGDSNAYVFSSSTSQPWNSEKTSVISIEIGTNIKPISTAYWAYGLENMTTGDFTKLDISSVTNMSYMFCTAGYNVTSFELDLSGWNTSSVTNMSRMFSNTGYNATTFNIGNLSGWDTSSVTDVSLMFNRAGYNATTWSIGNLSNWNTSNVTNMDRMFLYAGYSSTTFNIGNLLGWDTSKVTNMHAMFNVSGYSATTFSIGDLSSWDTSQVTDMSSMFSSAGYNATTWSIGNLSNWDTSKVTNMIYMFSNAGYNATTFNIGNLSGWDTSQVTDMSLMFNRAGYSATTWSIGDLSSWDTSNVTNMDRMFLYAGYNATTFNIGNLLGWDTSKVTNMHAMFNVSGYSATTWSIGDLSSWDTSQVTDMSSMFSSAGYNATTWSIGNLSNWDTSKVTNMIYMFSSAGYNATTFSVGNLSGWDTSKVTNMSGMFEGAGLYATTWSIGNLSSWDTSKVTDMSSMFASAGWFATTFDIGNLSGWNTSQVTNMRSMFSLTASSAKSFVIGDLSGWDTSSVTNMEAMFSMTATDGGAQWSLDCSGWNVNNVTKYGAFNYYNVSRVIPPTWVN